MTIPFKKLKDEWMKDAAFRAEYEKLKPEFALALVKARAKAGMTQADVARRMRTSSRWSRASKTAAILRT
jgi:ribosome-binding protein aMBF1 (putative translation factor)